MWGFLNVMSHQYALIVSCFVWGRPRSQSQSGTRAGRAGALSGCGNVRKTDSSDRFWPQVICGLAIMFCLLPPTRLALGHLEDGRVSDASGLFNLMRNPIGVIGLALIDTVIYTHAPSHARALVVYLQARDLKAARFVGVPHELFSQQASGPPDDATMVAGRGPDPGGRHLPGVRKSTAQDQNSGMVFRDQSFPEHLTTRVAAVSQIHAKHNHLKSLDLFWVWRRKVQK